MEKVLAVFVLAAVPRIMSKRLYTALCAHERGWETALKQFFKRETQMRI